jgi:hypothetical protein
MGEQRNSYSVLVGKPEENNQLGRSTHRNEDDIKMDIKETEWKSVDWINPAQNRYKLRIR